MFTVVLAFGPNNCLVCLRQIETVQCKHNWSLRQVKLWGRLSVVFQVNAVEAVDASTMFDSCDPEVSRQEVRGRICVRCIRFARGVIDTW